MTEQTILFDLDGTLVDTAPDLIHTLNVLLKEEMLDPVPYESARHLVGTGVRGLVDKAFTMHGVEWCEDRFEDLFERFIAYYYDHIAVHSKPFPHVIETLRRLKSENFRLAVCTNKRSDLAIHLLKSLSMDSYFDMITGPDTFNSKKPDPDQLLKTIDAIGGNRKQSFMVGDAQTDVDAAHNAGIPVIGVPFGYTPTPIADLKPTVIMEHYRDFFKILDMLR